MKTMILSLLLGAACVTTAEIDPPMSWDSALPLQASVCDVAGIGRVLTQNGTNANVQIDLLWYGSVTNNLLCLDTSGDTSLPTNSAPFVLFASQYGTFLNLEPMECRFSYIFDMDYHRTRYEPDGMYLLNGDRSWFPVTPENAQMVNWCSNLVYVAQVTTNRQAFYELIREGYRLHPETSRIHRDSEYAFQYFHYYMTTNFMQQVWSDTNLVGWARSWVNMSYQQETKTWLP